MKNQTKTLIAVNTIGFAAVLVVNYLANSLPLNGKNTGELSDLYPNLFVPAGLTFAIWGVIYTWLLALVVCQIAALFSDRLMTRVEPLVQKTGWLFAVICVYNVLWLFAWHWQQLLASLLIMIYMLKSLVDLSEKTGSGRFKANMLEKWLVHAPFGIYQGWITIALIANITATLVAFHWNGFGVPEHIWTIAVIGAGVAVAAYMLWRQHNIFHGLAVAWALFGIWLKRSGAGDAPEISGVALAGMGIVLVLSAWYSRKWLSY